MNAGTKLGSYEITARVGAGGTRLYYATDVGMGEESFVIRSASFIDENIRGSESVDFSVRIPPGARIYDETTLRLLADLERETEPDALTGRAWSFLDLLEVISPVIGTFTYSNTPTASTTVGRPRPSTSSSRTRSSECRW